MAVPARTVCEYAHLDVTIWAHAQLNIFYFLAYQIQIINFFFNSSLIPDPVAQTNCAHAQAYVALGVVCRYCGEIRDHRLTRGICNSDS